MPSVRRKVCDRRNRPASARAFFGQPALAILSPGMSRLSISVLICRKSEAVPDQVRLNGSVRVISAGQLVSLLRGGSSSPPKGDDRRAASGDPHRRDLRDSYMPHDWDSVEGHISGSHLLVKNAPMSAIIPTIAV